MIMEDDKNKIEIIDSSTKNSKASIFSNLICFIIVIIFSTTGFILFLMFPKSLTGFFISFITISIVLIYSWIQSKSQGIFRKFSISEDGIEFLMPNIHRFYIKWSDFQKLEVTLKNFDIKPFKVYQLEFTNKNSKELFNFSILDFTSENINKILKLIKTYTIKRNIKFIAKEENLISGIVFVDDLEI